MDPDQSLRGADSPEVKGLWSCENRATQMTYFSSSSPDQNTVMQSAMLSLPSLHFPFWSCLPQIFQY